MPKITLPPAPEIKFGVWDRHGHEVGPGEAGTMRAGYKVSPIYSMFGRFSTSVHTDRNAAIQNLGVQRMSYAARVDKMKMQALNDELTTVLTGHSIDRVERRLTYGYWFYMTRGGIIKTEFNYSGSQYNAEVMAPEGPLVVKRWLKTQKIIRCEDGKSIELKFYGRLHLTMVPDWFMAEAFDDG